MIDFDPLNVRGRRLPASTSEPSRAAATLAAAIRTGRVPNSFDKRTLTLLPPDAQMRNLPNGAVGEALRHHPAWRLRTGRPATDPCGGLRGGRICIGPRHRQDHRRNDRSKPAAHNPPPRRRRRNAQSQAVFRHHLPAPRSLSWPVFLRHSAPRANTVRAISDAALLQSGQGSFRDYPSRLTKKFTMASPGRLSPVSHDGLLRVLLLARRLDDTNLLGG